MPIGMVVGPRHARRPEVAQGRHGTNPSTGRLSESVPPAPLLDATPECLVVVGVDGVIDFANRRAVELTGYSPRELEGRSFDSLIPWSSGDPGATPFDTLCRRADGVPVPVEVRVGTLDGPERSLIVSFRDVSDQRAGEEAKVVAEAKFRTLVEQISAITYTWTWREDEYLVLYTSPQIEPILGYTPEEWVAHPTAWYDWVHPEDRSAVIEENKRCERTAEAYSMQYRMIPRDGRIIWVEESWVVVDDEDERRVFQGVVFDITERKLAEREIAFLAHHDKLTGLPNRASFEETLEMAIMRARRHDLGVGVLYLDLDNFKLLNDSLGHQAG